MNLIKRGSYLSNLSRIHLNKRRRRTLKETKETIIVHTKIIKKTNSVKTKRRNLKGRTMKEKEKTRKEKRN